jgi:hypothetical protein
LTRLAGQYDELATAQALQRPLGNSRTPDKHEA